MSVTGGPASASVPTVPFRFDLRELSGAFADLGVLVPIAVALIIANGLSATAVLLPAGLLYIAAAGVYRLPVPVQPLKAFGAIAIARGIGPDGIAAGALLMGLVFLVLGATGLLDLAARFVPKPVVRGVQLSVGLLFLQIAYGLVNQPPHAFIDATRGIGYLGAGAVAVAVAGLVLRRRPVTLVLVGLAVVAVVVAHVGAWQFGPSPLRLPSLDAGTLATAFAVLVLPQLPLTFANSCLATADVARTYYGEAAEPVRPGRLAMTLGAANLFAASISGMPVCHGAGGMTAHRSFGARTGGAPLTIGVVLIVIALVFGAGLSGLLGGFPLPILAGLLTTAGLLHIALLRDLEGAGAWTLAIGVGILGYAGSLALALVLGIALWWGAQGLKALRAGGRRAGPSPGR
jgi:sulfate permease, SulP family